MSKLSRFGKMRTKNDKYESVMQLTCSVGIINWPVILIGPVLLNDVILEVETDSDF